MWLTPAIKDFLNNVQKSKYIAILDSNLLHGAVHYPANFRQISWMFKWLEM